jgi:hypothetical protein
VLELVADYFGCGTIRPDPGDNTLKWETRRLHDIVERVLPHFERYRLISAKQGDVDILALICRMMLERQHLRSQGLLRIAELAARMNPSGSRRYSVEQIMTSVR